LTRAGFAAAILLAVTVVPLAASSAAAAPTVANPGSTSILTAPPLAGGTVSTGPVDPGGYGITWYSVYKTPSGTPASITVTNGGCSTFDATLLDSNGTADAAVATGSFTAGSTVLSVPASQADDPQGLYYLELAVGGTGCGGNYSVDPEPAGQFATPAAPTVGTAALNGSMDLAWPELIGGHLYLPPTRVTAPAPYWYSLYKRSDSTLGTVRIVVGEGCSSPLTFTLLDANGYADPPVTLMTLPSADSAVTLTIPGQSSGDPSGLYYLVRTSKSYCADYGIEPSAEFVSHPTLAWPQPLLGTTAALAWPNLVGARRYLPAQYPQVIPKTRWYTLGKLRNAGPATVRVVDATGPGSSGCVVRLYSSASTAARPIGSKVLNANEAVTFNVPAKRAGGSGPIDQYYLSLTSASSCGYLSRTVSGGLIEPEPASAWGWGIHASITGTAKSSATGLRFGLNYAGTITASRRQVWAKFTVGAPATFLGTSITSFKPFGSSVCGPGIALLDPAGHVVSTYSWDISQVARVPLHIKGTYYIHVWFPSSCKPPASYEFVTQVRS
jgi:hypothetical protein